MSTLTVVANVFLFQVAWFVAILGAARGLPWVGVIAVAVVVGAHIARARMPGRELALVLAATVIGAVFETILVRAGLLQFSGGVLLAGTAPVWMVALWSNFATTLNVSLRVLHHRLLSAALLGAVGAPLAYYAGSQLGAVRMPDVRSALVTIAIGWTLLTPLLLLGARRLDGYAPR